MRVTGVLENASKPNKFSLQWPLVAAWRTSSIERQSPLGESGVAAEGRSEGGRVTGSGCIWFSGVSMMWRFWWMLSSLLARLEMENRDEERRGWRRDEGRAL